MRAVSWQFIGNCWREQYNEEDIIQIIDECTSNYDGFVDAIVFENESQFVGKKPMIKNDNFYLAVYTITFVILLDVSVLDSKEFIFICGNDINHCGGLEV